VKTFFSGCLVLELAFTDVGRRPVPQFRVGSRPKEDKIIQEGNQDCQFGAEGAPKQWNEQEGQTDVGEPLEFQRQDKEDVNLHVRVKRGESEEKGRIQEERRDAATPEEKGRNGDADHPEEIEERHPECAPSVLKGIAHPDQEPKVDKEKDHGERRRRGVAPAQQDLRYEYVRNKPPNFAMENSFGDQEKCQNKARLEEIE
jgi:hypothetical protein